MSNPLLSRLREKDKHGLFEKTQTSVSYNTNFLPFDFKNGYMIQVRDYDDKLIKEYPSTGLVGGTFTTIIGKSGVAKTIDIENLNNQMSQLFESITDNDLRQNILAAAGNTEKLNKAFEEYSKQSAKQTNAEKVGVILAAAKTERTGIFDKKFKMIIVNLEQLH